MSILKGSKLPEYIMLETYFINEEADSQKPYRDLLCEIINRSLRDYLNPTIDGRQERRSAEVFFFCGADANIPFSFNWICAQIDISPKIILERIKKGDKMPDF